MTKSEIESLKLELANLNAKTAAQKIITEMTTSHFAATFPKFTRGSHKIRKGGV